MAQAREALDRSRPGGRPPETIYLRRDGTEFVVGFLNVRPRIKEHRFTDRDLALRFAEELKRIMGSELVINLDEPLQ